VFDLLTTIKERVFPVGRLDYDSEGALLLTNDGVLAQQLLHPRFKAPKRYAVKVAGVPSAAELSQLAHGVIIDEKPTLPAIVAIRKHGETSCWLDITLYEGRNRQVRRMCEAIGYRVLKLKRTAISFLTLRGLRPGEYRFLSAEEVQRLQRRISPQHQKKQHSRKKLHPSRQRAQKGS
jgi:pseudouridine synthase